MSSFSENFQRDENKNAQYDDSAFYIFAMSMLIVGIIILIIVIFRQIFHDKKFSDPKYRNCQCQACQTRLNSFNLEIYKKHINFTFYFYLILLGALIYLMFLSYNQISQTSGKLKTFDPYEILEIDSVADERTIKKAYKRLALQYHPDKNPNNLQAKTKFMLIAKAYDALTKEESMKNYEKYGNPDGPTPFRISVALPSFILEKKNHMPILILFVLFILIILPVSFLMWISKSNQYDDSGVMVTDNIIFYQYLNENSLLKQMPFVMGLAQEYSSLKIRPEESDALGTMYKKNLDLMSKHKLETIPPSNKKAICILYSYINNTPMTYPLYEQDLVKVLKPTNLFIDNMYKMAINCTQIHNLGRRDIKQFGYNCIRTIFDFSQNLHQRISHVNNSFSSFMQLPYLTEQKIKLMSKNYRKVFHNKSTVFSDFLQLPIEERKTILSVEYSKDEIDDIEKAIASIPIYEMKIETFVEGFEDILVDDLVTYKFTIERKNIKGDEVSFSYFNYI